MVHWGTCHQAIALRSLLCTKPTVLRADADKADCNAHGCNLHTFRLPQHQQVAEMSADSYLHRPQRDFRHLVN